MADLIVTYGDLARIIGAEAVQVEEPRGETPPAVVAFGLDQRAELVAFLRRELREGDVVLLKGSRGLKMEEMVDVLRTDAGPNPGAPSGSDISATAT